MREDIQCLRGVSITFVFLYHLLPHIFHNGYLGVDIFFVISGYLMARHLTISPVKSIYDIGKFYYKRFKRILPLYYLTISFTILGVHLFLGHFWWKNNQKYAISAMFCVTNQRIIRDSEDYFAQFLVDGSAVNAFIHTWSLGVEMQFYLIVPFICIGLQLLKNKILKLLIMSFVTIIGFICFASILSHFSFNFMLLRLWQFTAGFIALYLNQMISRTKQKYSGLLNVEKQRKFKLQCSYTQLKDLTDVALSCLFLCLLPFQLDPLWLRPLTTLITVFIIACESRNNQLFKSSQLAYLGDISYVIYLVHWPIITIFLGSTPDSYIFCTVSTLLISIFLHHFFEKRYLKFDKKSTVSLIIMLIALNSLLLYSVQTHHDFWRPKMSDEVREVIERNEKTLPYEWMVSPRNETCTENETTGTCVYSEGNGNTSVMVVGNSYCLSLENHIQRQFERNYSHFHIFPDHESFGLYANDNELSKPSLQRTRKIVEKVKPDVLFITARYFGRINENLKISKKDELVQEMNENIAFYEKFVKKIFILDAFPAYRPTFASIFLHFFIQNKDLEVLHLNKQKADKEMRNMKRRFEMIKCKKCKFFDLSLPFIENDKYISFDREHLLSYIDDSIHLTAPALELCEPIFRKVVQEAISF